MRCLISRPRLLSINIASDYANVLPRFLPPSLLNPLLTVLTTSFGILKTLQTHLSPLLLRLTTQPDIASLALLLIILFVSFKILDMAYRAVVFWISLVFKLVMWGGIIVLGFWVYNRGVDGFAEDVRELVEFWSGEYERYEGEVKRFKGMKEEQIRVRQGGKGSGRRGWL